VKDYVAKSLYRASLFPLLFVTVLWIFFFMQVNTDLNFLRLGILPRQSEGMPGILTSVLVHGDIGHITSNSIPIIVLGMMLFHFYKKIAIPAFMWIWVISGIWLWIGGRNNDLYPMRHIGASTLIYGLATFLFFSGVFRRHIRLMVVSALVVFLYGSIMWGIFPLKEEMSWEGHLFGAIAGVLVAYNYRREGPQRKVYEWENEEEEDGTAEEISRDPGTADINPAEPLTPRQEITITYSFRPKAGTGNQEQQGK
jgi:membrane associated rhomboid family serine protease